MLDEAGHKPGKEERKAQAARKTVIDRLFTADDGVENKAAGFADPALMFE